MGYIAHCYTFAFLYVIDTFIPLICLYTLPFHHYADHGHSFGI
jgi:hypothetical protein